MNTPSLQTLHLQYSGAVACTALALLCAPAAWAQDDGEIPFDEAEVFFELNNTDGDLGIHALIDGGPWRKIEIYDINENRILVVRNSGRLRRQGMSELFFESAEPTFDELPPEKFFQRFPEGIYEVEGLTLDGQELESEAEVTHVMPAPPGNVLLSGQPAAEDCDADPLPVVSHPVIIDWDPVTTSHPDLGKTAPIEIVQYEVVVEREEPTPLIFSMELPPNRTRVRVPRELINLGEEFKFEILVREASGNQTAIESCFEKA